MKPLAVGEIVLVKFPFANLREAKKRPALVLRTTEVTSKASLVTIAMITSQVDGLELEGDVLVSKWKDVNLLHPSLVRLSKMATIDSELIDGRIGHLADSDQKHVSRTFKKLFASWI